MYQKKKTFEFFFNRLLNKIVYPLYLILHLKGKINSVNYWKMSAFFPIFLTKLIFGKKKKNTSKLYRLPYCKIKKKQYSFHTECPVVRTSIQEKFCKSEQDWFGVLGDRLAEPSLKIEDLRSNKTTGKLNGWFQRTCAVWAWKTINIFNELTTYWL